MADEHGKDDEEVRGQDGRTPHNSNDPHEADDLSAVQADDRLLDALGSATPGAAGSLVDDELNVLLLAWRHEVETPPFGELVDTETAIATIQAARPQSPSRHRFLIPLASAAAVMAIAFTGVSLVARDAQPGDALWGLTRVLYSEHAKSIEAAAIVKGDLASARLALREGKVDEAREKLDKVGQSLGSVSTSDGKAELEQDHKQLEQELNTNTSATSPTTPSVPRSTKQTKPSSKPPTSQSPTSAPPTSTSPTSPSSETPPPPTSNAGEEPPPPPPPPAPEPGTGETPGSNEAGATVGETAGSN